MISEEMIKNAATEADQAIRDSLPAPAECEHEFSPLFQRKMCILHTHFFRTLF